MQVWPAFRNLPIARRGTAVSKSASGAIRAGDLPPSSRVTGVRLSAAAIATLRPTAVDDCKLLRREMRRDDPLEQRGGPRRQLARFEQHAIASRERRERGEQREL